MKYLFPLALLLFFDYQLFAKEDPKIVTETIQKVTVFQSSAQIESFAQTMIDGNTSQVIFKNLPANINRKSIQVSGEGDFTILSIESKQNFINSQKKSNEALAIEDSIEKYSYILEMEDIKKYALDQEESLLINNKNFASKEGTVVDIEDMAVLYQTRLPKIKQELYQISKEITRLSDILTKFEKELALLTVNRATTDIIVNITAKNPQNITLNLSYIVTDVYWTPLYDIRAKDINSPMNISYKAQVIQKTGVDWNNIKLVLSTGNPSISGVKPTLTPWYLEYINPDYGYYRGAKKNSRSLVPSEDTEESYMKSEDATKTKAITSNNGPASTPANYIEATQSQLARNFEIQLPYSVPSDGKPKTVEVQNYTVQPIYEYVTTPKLDQNAYLMAGITDWEKLNLLSSAANVFFEGAFVGETILNAQNTEDTLKISLGSDKNIVIKREKVNDMSSSKTIGSTRKIILTYEITVRNTKNNTISISVEDQLPVPQDKSIELKINDLQGAEYNELTGMLKWPLKLGPSETKKVRYSYEIKYAKGKFLNGLE